LRVESFGVESLRVESFRVESLRVESLRVGSFKVESFRVESFRVESFKVESFRVVSFRVEDLGRGVQGGEFRVEGLGGCSHVSSGAAAIAAADGGGSASPASAAETSWGAEGSTPRATWSMLAERRARRARARRSTAWYAPARMVSTTASASSCTCIQPSRAIYSSSTESHLFVID